MSIRPELRDELLRLSAEERQELADELYESLDGEPDDPEWERAWAAELERRVQDVVDGRVELLEADAVHADLRADLRDTDR
jgi:putative addiction module component (TIGR02574 family)